MIVFLAAAIFAASLSFYASAHASKDLSLEAPAAQKMNIPKSARIASGRSPPPRAT